VRWAPRRFFMGASLAAAAAWVAKVGAQTAPGVEITWTAPPGCPVAADVQKGVRGLLGGEGQTSLPTERLVVEGTVDRVRGRYRLRLVVRRGGESATRALESDSCESLAGAAAVSVALLAREERHGAGGAPPASPSARLSGPPSSPPSDRAARLASGSSEPTAASPASSADATAATPSPSPPPAVAPPDARPTPASTSASSTGEPGSQARARARSLAPELSASVGSASGRPGPEIRDSSGTGRQSVESRSGSGVVLQVPILAFDEGTVPSPSYGLGLGAGFRAQKFEVLVTGRLWLPQPDPDEYGSFGATYTRASGELSGCYRWGLAGFGLSPCVNIGLEYVAARGSGPAQTPPDFGTWSAGEVWATVGLAARASWSPIRWAALFVRPSLALNTSRPTFIINEASSLYRVPLAAVGIDLGCEWIL